jgi:hypothetical protein
VEEQVVCTVCGERNPVESVRCRVCHETLGLRAEDRWPPLHIDITRWPAVWRWVAAFVAFDVVEMVLTALISHVTAPPTDVRRGIDLALVALINYLAIRLAAFIAPSYRKTTGYVLATGEIAQYASVIPLTVIPYPLSASVKPVSFTVVLAVVGILASIAAVVMIKRDDDLKDQSSLFASLDRYPDHWRWIALFPAAVAGFIAPDALVAGLNILLGLVHEVGLADSTALSVGGALFVSIAASIAPGRKSHVAWSATALIGCLLVAVSTRLVVKLLQSSTTWIIYDIPVGTALMIDWLGSTAGAAIAAFGVSRAASPTLVPTPGESV